MLSGSDAKIKITALLVASLTFLIYLPALQNGFVNWDDPLYITDNDYIKSLDLKFLKWMFSFEDTIWVPLTRLSHALNYAVWGLNPMGHHLMNIFLHGLNTFLVVILVVRLLESIRIPNYPVNSNVFLEKTLICGGITGILFGIHPLHVESVAWITERKDVLSAFFMFLSIICYLTFVSYQAEKKRRTYYALSFVSFALALMSKPVVVTLPAVLFILDIYPLKRFKSGTGFGSKAKIIVEKIPFILLSVTVAVFTLLTYEKFGLTTTLNLHVSLMVRFLVAVRALCFYLVKMLLPLNLVPIYPYPLEASIFSPEFMGSLLLVLSITAFCIYRWRKQKIWMVVWIYYLITLIPVVGIIQFGSFSAADRYSYLPSLGPFFLIGLGVAAVYGGASGTTHFKKVKTSLLAVIVFLVTILSVFTIKQIRIWENSISLWSAQIRIFPDTYRSYKSLADAYEKEDKYNESIKYLNKAVEINSGDPELYYFRGMAYGKAGLHLKAIKDFEKAIKMDPRKAKYHHELGIANGNLGNYRQAVNNLSTAIELDPQLSKSYYYRGIAYKGLDLHDYFIKDFRTAAGQGYKNAQDYLLSNGLSW